MNCNGIKKSFVPVTTFRTLYAYWDNLTTVSNDLLTNLPAYVTCYVAIGDIGFRSFTTFTIPSWWIAAICFFFSEAVYI